MDKYYKEIKNRIIDVETTIKVKDYSKNKVMVENYYEIGKLIVEAQGGESRAKYGNKLIKEYANHLTLELGKGYTYTALSRMRKFYLLFQKVAPVAQDLTWSNWVELLSIKDINEIRYYIGICYKNDLTKRQLREKIKSKEYEKLSIDIKNKLISNQELDLKETITDPIIINNSKNIEVINEKVIQKLIVEDIYSFLKRLGTGYMFVGNEYPIKIGDRTYKIDLLLYNIEYECYIVIELKIGELKHNYIGQVELYMNYIDKEIKKENHNKTIGIILCQRNNRLIMEYCSNPNITIREYLLTN